ncbi:MAG: protein kinase [archaeon]|nr:protein kinase [archaeon]
MTDEFHSRSSKSLRTEIDNFNQPYHSKLTTIGEFTLGKKLGEGTFGVVRIATHNLTGEKVAVKIIEKAKIVEKSDKSRVEKEIQILKQLHHNNIIRLYSVIQTASTVCLVMEYAPGKELFDYITLKRRLQEVEACKFYQQIISGIEYLNKVRIVHRDIKPENLLLDADNNIKLADFGLSNFYPEDDLLSTACGSPCYAAPEMIKGEKYLGVMSDIWSSGVVLFAMLCGYLPFEDKKNSVLYRKITEGRFSIPFYLSEHAHDIISRILVTDPTKRFTIEQIKRHPWFNLINQRINISHGLLLSKYVIPIDEEIISKMTVYKYDPEEIRKNILLNKHNHLTSTYYLLLNKKIREGHISVGDLKSTLFQQYLQNKKNLLINYNNMEEVLNERIKGTENIEEIEPVIEKPKIPDLEKVPTQSSSRMHIGSLQSQTITAYNHTEGLEIRKKNPKNLKTEHINALYTSVNSNKNKKNNLPFKLNFYVPTGTNTNNGIYDIRHKWYKMKNIEDKMKAIEEKNSSVVSQTNNKSSNNNTPENNSISITEVKNVIDKNKQIDKGHNVQNTSIKKEEIENIKKKTKQKYNTSFDIENKTNEINNNVEKRIETVPNTIKKNEGNGHQKAKTLFETEIKEMMSKKLETVKKENEKRLSITKEKINNSKQQTNQKIIKKEVKKPNTRNINPSQIKRFETAANVNNHNNNNKNYRTITPSRPKTRNENTLGKKNFISFIGSKAHHRKGSLTNYSFNYPNQLTTINKEDKSFIKDEKTPNVKRFIKITGKNIKPMRDITPTNYNNFRYETDSNTINNYNSKTPNYINSTNKKVEYRRGMNNKNTNEDNNKRFFNTSVSFDKSDIKSTNKSVDNTQKSSIEVTDKPNNENNNFNFYKKINKTNINNTKTIKETDKHNDNLERKKRIHAVQQIDKEAGRIIKNNLINKPKIVNRNNHLKNINRSNITPCDQTEGASIMTEIGTIQEKNDTEDNLFAMDLGTILFGKIKEVKSNLEKKLISQKVKFKTKGNKFICSKGGIKFEMHIINAPFIEGGLVIKNKKIEGNSFDYKEILKSIIFKVITY